jgi:hypothetical protein
MLRKSFRRWSAAFAATATLVACAAAQAFTPPPFPRIGGIQIGGPFDYNEASYESQLARQSLMILNYWPGMAPGGESMDSVVKGIKAINPNALVFLYTDSDEQFTDPTGSADATLRTKLDSMKWWLYTSKSLDGMVPSFYGDGGETINNTPYTPKDSSGQDSIDWIGRWFVSNYYTPNPHIDGFFMDNVFTQPRGTGIATASCYSLPTRGREQRCRRDTSVGSASSASSCPASSRSATSRPGPRAAPPSPAAITAWSTAA